MKNLIIENKTSKKGNIVMLVIGIIIALFTLFLTMQIMLWEFVSGIGHYVDLPMFVLLLLLNIVLLFINGCKTKNDIIKCFEKDCNS